MTYNPIIEKIKEFKELRKISGVKTMVKYARIVFEVEIEDDATEQEILDVLEAHLEEFINNPWGINDVEIHDVPYNINKVVKYEI